MKTTHINHMRTEMLLNAILVKVEFSFSDIEYNEFIYTIGIDFLSKVYPNEDAQLKISRNQSFWRWWKVIYFNWEKELIEFFYDHKIDATRELYELEMKVLPQDQITEIQFNSYLKANKNVLCHRA